MLAASVLDIVLACKYVAQLWPSQQATGSDADAATAAAAAAADSKPPAVSFMAIVQPSGEADAYIEIANAATSGAAAEVGGGADELNTPADVAAPIA